MRIRSPYNPDILTYRDSVVYAGDHFQLEQRRLSSSLTSNGTFVDTYFSVLTILRPTIDDEGRYICARGREVFAEYDLFIISSFFFRCCSLIFCFFSCSSTTFCRRSKLRSTSNCYRRFDFKIIVFSISSSKTRNHLVLPNENRKKYSK